MLKSNALMMRRPGRPARGRRRVLARLALAFAVTLCGAAPVRGGEGGISLERRVKAAFLYKFLGYAEFPAASFAGPASPVTIGVLGADDIAAELARIAAGRSVGTRPIVVRALRENEPPGPAHLLYIGGRDCAQAARIARAPGALLVVTDCDNATPPGSAINFRIIDNRVRFDVSLDAAERNNVKISSRLLTVANHVEKGPLP